MASVEPLVIEVSDTEVKRCVAVRLRKKISVCVTIATIGLVAVVAVADYLHPNEQGISLYESAFNSTSSNSTVRIAFIGNSMIYYNDVPRFFSHLSGHSISQNSCLRGFADLEGLFKNGSDMREKFTTNNAMRSDGSYDIGAKSVKSLLNETWDYIIMNDYSQGPARNTTRAKTVKSLINDYAPLIKKSNATPIFLMTSAYRSVMKGSSDLGNVSEFTLRLYDGYQLYKNAMDEELGENRSKIAPLGKAYYQIYLENQTYWKQLFYIDNYHPSIYGTLLEGIVLHWTIFGSAPPFWNSLSNLFYDSRRQYPPEDNITVIYPSLADEKYLRDIAKRVCKAEGLG